MTSDCNDPVELYLSGPNIGSVSFSENTAYVIRFCLNVDVFLLMYRI